MPIKVQQWFSPCSSMKIYEGAGLGAALGNVAIGVGVGLAIGGGIGALRARRGS